jgi:hypothetical protein
MKERFKNLKNRLSCNSPRRTSGEKKAWVVKGCENGEEKLVRFGDPDMPDKSYDPERRKNFRARHKCDQKNTKLSARYWSCKKW